MSEAQIEAWFPSLHHLNYHITSPSTPFYNCVAWAAGVIDRPWWPFDGGGNYWPPQAPRELTVPAFIAAFSTLGYAVCENDQLEPHFEKIAIYAKEGLPQHVARQLASGRWTSKLGNGEDIDHLSPPLLHGNEYGYVVVVMRRPVV